MRIFQDDRIEVWTDQERCLIKCRRPYELKALNEVLSAFPRVSISNFMALKDALIKASNEEVEIGAFKPEIEIEISKDGLAAHCKLNMTEEEAKLQKENLQTKVLEALELNGVCYGIKEEWLSGDLAIQKRFQVAEGLLPIAGDDAVLTYYQLSEKRPEVKTDGNVDHFDIHLIDPIEAGDWLGEKIPATPGVVGMTVRKEVIPPKPGRDLPLKYDKETVNVIRSQDGKEVLRAAITGAVSIKNQAIGVDNHLIIAGNVDYSTGNIDFDGFVTVRGTVEDLFSVTATHDISIMGDMGIGAVDFLNSREGSVFVKGGINGKGQAKITAKKNVYLKYCSEVTIEAGGSVQIGGYAYDAKIVASRVEMLKSSSKIVGGSLIAKHQVVSGVIGNQSERETEVKVLGFDRLQLKTELENLEQYFKDVLDRGNKVKRQIEVFELNIDKLDQKAINTYHLMQQEFEKIIQEIASLRERMKQMEDVLRIRGDGEIKVLSQIHPKSALEIKHHKKHIQQMVTGSFYVKDNRLHHVDV